MACIPANSCQVICWLMRHSHDKQLQLVLLLPAAAVQCGCLLQPHAVSRTAEGAHNFKQAALCLVAQASAQPPQAADHGLPACCIGWGMAAAGCELGWAHCAPAAMALKPTSWQEAAAAAAVAVV
jgi:hypothetical protein